MNSKERILLAIQRKKADHVPVSPDISVMVPDKMDGRPFYDIHLDGREHHGWTSATHGEVYVEAIKKLEIDGFYMYGALPEIRSEDTPDFESEVTDVPQGKAVRRVCQTKKGTISEEEIFFRNDAPWRKEKPVKDLKKDFEILQLQMGRSGWKYADAYLDKHVIGDHGIYMGMIPVFQDWWFHNRQGGFEQVFMDFMLEPAYMDMIHEWWMEWAMANIHAMTMARPDVVMLGGSSASLSVSSPQIFRKYELPFIQKASKVCKDHDLPCHLHVCGKSWQLVQIVAEETDIVSMEPLEEPPTGNIDLAEAKKRYGEKICIKGNLNTTEFLLRATPDQVEEKCKRAIDAAADGGGFILSTGDQVGRDTPIANLVKMVEVAKTYGKY